MTEDVIKSKVLVFEPSKKSATILKSFFLDNEIVGIKANAKNTMALLRRHNDLGAVFLPETSSSQGWSWKNMVEKIHALHPELPIFVGMQDVCEVNSANEFFECYQISDLKRLSKLVDQYLFSRYYPIEIVRGIQELSKDAFNANMPDCDICCESPFLVKDNIIFGELLSLMPLESDWCRGYMMLQTTKKEVLSMIANNSTLLENDAFEFSDVNSFLNEITNLIWGGIRNRFFLSDDEHGPRQTSQVPILVNHKEKYISFGTKEPQLCFKYVVTSKKEPFKSIVFFQKLIFNLDWRPEDFKPAEMDKEDELDTGELEFF